MAVTLYCAWSDVTARLSQAGATLRTDDDPSTRDSVLRRAAVFVNQHCQLLYSPTALAASAWVTEAAADVAAFYASTRRGNPAPASVKEQYDRVEKSLIDVQMGRMTIPDAAQRKAMAPVLSNQRVQQWPVSEVRTVQGTSTGNPQNYPQNTDQFDVWDYSI